MSPERTNLILLVLTIALTFVAIYFGVVASGFKFSD